MRRIALFLAFSVGIATAALAKDEAAANAALFKGLKAFNAGNARAARVDLLNAVKADPDNVLAHAANGRVMLALGDAAGAQAALDKALSLGIPRDRLGHLLGHAAMLQGNINLALQETAPGRVHPMFGAYAARIRGRSFMMAGDFANATREFNTAIRLGPYSSTLWTDIGRFRMVSGDLKSAIDAAQEAVRRNPRNIDALILAGELMRQQYGLVAAIPVFQKALQVDENNLVALIELAATLGDAGRNKDMLAMTRKILALEPGNPQAYYLQAVMAARANRPDLARALLYRTSGALDEMPSVMLLRATIEVMQGADEQAIVRLRPLLDLQPTNIKARRLMGAAMWRTGDIKGTIETLGPIGQRRDADSYTLSILGRAFEADGNRAEASRLLDRAAMPFNADPAPFGQMGGSGTGSTASAVVPMISGLIANGQLGEAMARSASLQMQNPGAPSAHVVRGDSLAAAGQWGAAVEAYRRAANLRFSETTALRLIRALQQAKRPQEAVAVLDTYLGQNPRSTPARRLAAEVFMGAGQWNRAIKTLENLRDRLGDRDAALLNNLAWSYLQIGRNATAHSYAEAAYRMAPNNPAIMSTYGWVLTITGIDKPTGLAALEKATAIAPRHPGIRFQLAQAYQMADRKEEARKAAQLALSNPAFVERDAAKALLKAL
jgi:tetratricopeptide (TPR) repeat protein